MKFQEIVAAEMLPATCQTQRFPSSQYSPDTKVTDIIILRHAGISLNTSISDYQPKTRHNLWMLRGTSITALRKIHDTYK